MNRVKGLRPGAQCPACLMRITEQNLPEVRNRMLAELKSLAEQGKERVAQGKELAGMDYQSKTVFEQFKADDLKKLYEELKRKPPAKPMAKSFAPLWIRWRNCRNTAIWMRTSIPS